MGSNPTANSSGPALRTVKDMSRTVVTENLQVPLGHSDLASQQPGSQSLRCTVSKDLTLIVESNFKAWVPGQCEGGEELMGYIPDTTTKNPAQDVTREHQSRVVGDLLVIEEPSVFKGMLRG